MESCDGKGKRVEVVETLGFVHDLGATTVLLGSEGWRGLVWSEEV